MGAPITIVCIDGRHGKRGAAVKHCLRLDLPFVATGLILSPEWPGIIGGVEWQQIPEMDWHGYSRFCLHELHKYIKTDHCLVVQDDGYILNPELWNDDWRKLDYIGAPWSSDGVVGNGGFSLRSKRLLEFCSTLNLDGLQNEDEFICRDYSRDGKTRYRFNEVLAAGLIIAPTQVALRFSRETTEVDFPTFGFHGTKHAPLCSWI